jgi:hypothetical protein
MVLIFAGSPHSAPALDWADGSGLRFADVSVSAQGKTGFTLMPPPVSGILFTNFLPEPRYRTNQILLNGSGVAAGDVDGDGWCDLYFARLTGPDVLYRNLGNWKFQDMTASSGVGGADMDASGCALADLDGDGDLDLVVNSVGHGTRVWLNDGRARFTELTQSSVLNPGKGATSLALGDYDGDGWLDLYVANYRFEGLMDRPNTKFWLKTIGGRKVVASVDDRPVTDPEFKDRFFVNAAGGIEELGETDVLYRNLGGTQFMPVPFTSGAFLDEEGRVVPRNEFDWSLTVAFRDLNADGAPDLYVCNDFDSPDRLWLNQGNGRFRLAPRLTFRKTTLFSMSADFADLNRDGHDDVFVLDMLSRHRVHRMTTMSDRTPPTPVIGLMDDRPQYMINMLYLNRGDGTYAELGEFSGLARTEWSWAVACLDADLDGWEDVLVNNGHEREGRHLDIAEQLKAQRATRQMTRDEILAARRLFPRLATPNLAFRNRRDLTFEDRSQEWGFDLPSVSHGLALADLDNDGDLDLAINNLNQAATLYRNDSPAPRLAVRLKGLPPNTRGIGARITVTGGPVAQTQEMMSGGRYLSSDDPMRVFAAGSVTNLLTVEVAWRSGRRSVVAGLRPNRVYEVSEASAAPAVFPKLPPPAPQPFFRDVSQWLAHRHVEEPFDDYARQPLLPYKLSQLGPGVSWYDVNGDGWDDLLIASGRGGLLGYYRNDGRGGFAGVLDAPFNQYLTRDHTTVLAWPRGPGRTALLAGSANYEEESASGSCVRLYDLSAQMVEETLPAQPSSTGPLAMADVDGDGDLDLFVGGRVVPGKYPRAASSALFRNQDGRLVLDSQNAKALTDLGLVSGAVFSDLDADGDPDLVLACEWGPLRICLNEQGRLTARDWPLSWPTRAPNSKLQTPTLNPQPSTLNQLTGWWNGVTTGDFDGDGRLDLLASNAGSNTRYQSHRARPLEIFFGDFDGDGAEDVMEAHYDAEFGSVMPERSLSFFGKSLPFIRERFRTHEAYARASVEDVLSERFKAAGRWQAVWLESAVFLNRGTTFEVRALPAEAQVAPAFGVCVADFDGDGRDDVFLGQNLLCLQPETPRCDAGRGLWLRGDGAGGFAPVPGQESGIIVYGEQRGCAVSDFDADGRVDLVVTQNGAATRLFHNLRAQPGVRVRLRGPPGNPQAVGAVLRMGSNGQFGPAREIHAGSGYWSQDSAVTVWAARSGPSVLWVRWPGGQVTQSPVPAGAKEVAVDASGQISAH